MSLKVLIILGVAVFAQAMEESKLVALLNIKRVYHCPKCLKVCQKQSSHNCTTLLKSISTPSLILVLRLDGIEKTLKALETSFKDLQSENKHSLLA